MIPGAILVGLGAAPMWSAKCTYLTEVGDENVGMYTSLNIHMRIKLSLKIKM